MPRAPPSRPILSVRRGPPVESVHDYRVQSAGEALHFEAHARGTAAAGARLELELAHVRARCHACGQVYLPDHHLLLCPGCGSTEGEVLGESALRIDSMDVEEDQGGP